MILAPPIEPMLAKPLGSSIPTGDGIAFEPKWDGFRCLVFRSHSGVVLQGRGRSRSTAEYVDLSYAFPDVVAAVSDQVPPGTVLDGEIVVIDSGRLDFGLLTARLRPRSEAGGPNIARLATQTPASLLTFDVLEHAGRNLMAATFADRRAVLADGSSSWTAPILLTPDTNDAATAKIWFDTFESAGVDGLIVKPLTDPYQPGVRAQGKVKHLRTADVVLAGWRPHTNPDAAGRAVVGSLLLGLYDEAGALQYVGAASAFTAAQRADLVEILAPLAVDSAHPWRDPAPGTSVPGEANRWKREQPWVALRPDSVVEVAYEQMAGSRFRHLARFLRWRPDRDPVSCAFDQLDVPPPADIGTLLASS